MSKEIFLVHFTIFSTVCQISQSEPCTFEETTGILKCAGLNVTDTMLDLNYMIPDQQKSQVDNLIIENSTISVLDLNFIEKNALSALSGIGIHECNITSVIGTMPCHLNSLRLSNNLIANFSVTLMNYEIEANNMEVTSTNGSAEYRFIYSKKPCTESELALILNNNLLEELPMHVVGSTRLKSLHLSGNPLKCEFIWENVWEDLDCQQRPSECRLLFADENSANCQFYRQMLVPSGIFHYTLSEIFDSKITLEEECFEMNKTCDCHPFNLLRDEAEGGKPTAYLTINCSGRNLTELPTVSEYTWELNVSHNFIQGVNRLNESMYRNLRRLDISHNYVDDLGNFSNTEFMDRFDLLYVNFNRFKWVMQKINVTMNSVDKSSKSSCTINILMSLVAYMQISDSFLTKVKEADGKGMIKIGSQLECECQTVTQTKGKLIELQNSIVDLNDVVCWNIMQRIDLNNEENGRNHNEPLGNFLRLTDLKVNEVCSVPNSEAEAVDWVLVIIIFELICIITIIAKVYYDWRSYQRTGQLPWIAVVLPSLPCDNSL